jgi:hypothetical protein
MIKENCFPVRRNFSSPLKGGRFKKKELKSTSKVFFRFISGAYIYIYIYIYKNS